MTSRSKSHKNDLTAGSHLRHPLVVIMLIIWLLNDHVLKAHFGSWWTGKLSDIGGLIVCPVSMYSGYEVICAFRKRVPTHLKSMLWCSLIVTGLIFAMINTSPIAERLCSHMIAYLQWPIRAMISLLMGNTLPELNRLQTTMDITDLLTLPALIVPYKILK
jgi:hypothetical protein